MKRKAFTLAEVLLTLAIIGVVAALTIPAVITKVTKDQYVTGLKKAYNTLKAVEREARQEHGDMGNWAWTSGISPTADFEKYFLPHFDVLKNCGATTEAGCFAAEGVTALDGSAWNDVDDNRHYRIITSDGMSWAYGKYNNSDSLERRGYFYVDVNGLKGPNKYGRDIFLFDVYPSNLGIKPCCSYYPDGVTPKDASTIDTDCSTSSYGDCCAVKVLSEGKMDY